MKSGESGSLFDRRFSQNWITFSMPFPLVDTLGFIHGLLVCEASIQDRDAAKVLLLGLFWLMGRLQIIWADQAYAGAFVEWVWQWFTWVVYIVKRPAQAIGFQILPHRWIVERTFGWWENYRLLAKEYEYSPRCSESDIYLAMLQLMLKRLAR